MYGHGAAKEPGDISMSLFRNVKLLLCSLQQRSAANDDDGDDRETEENKRPVRAWGTRAGSEPRGIARTRVAAAGARGELGIKGGFDA